MSKKSKRDITAVMYLSLAESITKASCDVQLLSQIKVLNENSKLDRALGFLDGLIKAARQIAMPEKQISLAFVAGNAMCDQLLTDLRQHDKFGQHNDALLHAISSTVFDEHTNVKDTSELISTGLLMAANIFDIDPQKVTNVVEKAMDSAKIHNATKSAAESNLFNGEKHD